MDYFSLHKFLSVLSLVGCFMLVNNLIFVKIPPLVNSSVAKSWQILVIFLAPFFVFLLGKKKVSRKFFSANKYNHLLFNEKANIFPFFMRGSMCQRMASLQRSEFCPFVTWRARECLPCAGKELAVIRRKLLSWAGGGTAITRAKGWEQRAQSRSWWKRTQQRGRGEGAGAGWRRRFRKAEGLLRAGVSSRGAVEGH